MKNITLILSILILVLSGFFLLANRNVIYRINPNKEYFGIYGFAPINYPKFTDIDAKNYWKDINKSANIYGVNVSVINSDSIKFYSDNLQMPLYVVINQEDIFQTDKLYAMLDNNVNNIAYLGIGNEINKLYTDDPASYQAFAQKAKEVFPEIKKRYKNIQLFTVFQYESLIGKGYLFGNIYPNTTKLISEWENLVDFFGLTMYPHFDYEKPYELPDNYLDTFKEYTKKEFAITETTWPSYVDVFGAEDGDFNTSEVEQSEYIDWLKKLNDKYNPKFVGWLFFNDITFGNPLFTGSGLRDNTGVEKAGFYKWQQIIDDARN